MKEISQIFIGKLMTSTLFGILTTIIFNNFFKMTFIGFIIIYIMGLGLGYWYFSLFKEEKSIFLRNIEIENDK